MTNPLENSKIAADFVAAQQEASPERRGRATWGPVQVTKGAPLVYAPRFKTDHHPWVTDAMRHEHPHAQVRYANHEVEEVDNVAETRRKIEALDAELRRTDLDSSLRAAFIAERAELTRHQGN